MIKITKALMGTDIKVVVIKRFFMLKFTGDDACVPFNTLPLSPCVLIFICKVRNKIKNQTIENRTKTAVIDI